MTDVARNVYIDACCAAAMGDRGPLDQYWAKHHAQQAESAKKDSLLARLTYVEAKLDRVIPRVDALVAVADVTRAFVVERETELAAMEEDGVGEWANYLELRAYELVPLINALAVLDKEKKESFISYAG